MAGEQGKKFSELLEKDHAAANDKLVVVDTSNTANVWTKTMSVTDFLANTEVPHNLRLANNSTPANSTISVLGGTMFYDSDYLYMAVSNNVVKRIPLESF